MSPYDFGYSWPWTHGHLVPAALFGLLALLAWRLKWRPWIAILAGVLALWALAAFLIVQFAFRINLPLELPAQSFLASGSGTVLDAGAGSGRSALMVLQARPQARVVALDIFSASYIDGNSPEKLHRNTRAAGVDDRVETHTGDMRSMPFHSSSFDAAVSAYAIDHLRKDGIVKSLAEVERVIRPGGEFLLMVMNSDAWVRFAYPLMHAHIYIGHSPAADRWRSFLTEARFEIVEEGTKPATLYFLCRKRSQ